MPPNTVYVGRGSRWGNPFVVGEPVIGAASPLTAEQAVLLYREHIGFLGANEIPPEEIAAALSGKNLSCWCPLDRPCHADVLLELANQDSNPTTTPTA